MAKRPRKSLIGAFVLGGIAIIIAGIITLGVGRYFSRTPAFVMFFGGSVKGLNVGSAVVFRGVEIGKVTDISLLYDPDGKSVQIPVLVEIDPHRIIRGTGRTDPQAFIRQLISQGLRAQLQIQNLLTGQLIIELDFHPEIPARLVKSSIGYPEIPTIPSSMEQLTKTIEKLPVEELLHKLISAIEGVEAAVKSPELNKSIQSLNLAINDVRMLVQNVDRRVDPIASDIHGTLNETRGLVQDFDRQLLTMKDSLAQATEATRNAMTQAENTLRALERSGAPDAPVMYQLSRTLEELSAAAVSMRHLSDYLQRHPEAIVRGRKP